MDTASPTIIGTMRFSSIQLGLVLFGVPTVIAALLYAGVIAWELLSSALLWRAWRAMRRGAPGTAPEVVPAFAVSLALWAAFLIATEVTVNYATAGTHKLTLITQLVSLIVIRAQPARGSQ